MSLRRRPGLVPGLVSVVVPCYDVAEYLDESLTSLRSQDYRHVEIIVVDDGSRDRSAEIVRAHRREDARVRLVRRKHGGPSAARNAGIARARGEFLTFADADDVVRPEVFSAPVAALAESGSDFAVVCYDRLAEGVRKAAPQYIRSAHATRRLAQTVETFPEIMVNAIVSSRTYRREFWDRAGLSFAEGRLYEDQPVAMAAYARATAFDVLPVVGVSWRIRDDGSSISQASDTADNLREHTAAVHASLSILRRAGHPRAAEERALQVLTINLRYFLRHLDGADDAFWAELRGAVTSLIGGLSPELYAQRVPSQNKMLNELVMSDRREDVRAFLATFGQGTGQYRTWLDAEGVHCEHPFSDTVPSSCSVMSEAQLVLIVRALRLGLSPDGVLRVEGWAYIRNVDMAAHGFELRMALVNAAGGGQIPVAGDRVPVAVRTRPEPLTSLVAGHRHCDYRPGGYVATVDLADLPAGSWRLVATLSVGDDQSVVTRTAPVQDARIAGSGQVPRVVRLTPHGPGDDVAQAGADDYLAVDAVRRPVTVTRGPRDAIRHAGDDLARASLRSPGGSAVAAIGGAAAVGGSAAVVPTAVDCVVAGDELLVVVEGLPSGEWRPALGQGAPAAPSFLADGTLETTGPGRGRIGWDLSELPVGGYEVGLLPSGSGDPVARPIALSPELLDRLPVYELTARRRAGALAAPGAPPRLTVELASPSPDQTR